jgi:hypothetical protein
LTKKGKFQQKEKMICPWNRRLESGQKVFYGDLHQAVMFRGELDVVFVRSSTDFSVVAAMSFAPLPESGSASS